MFLGQVLGPVRFAGIAHVVINHDVAYAAIASRFERDSLVLDAKADAVGPFGSVFFSNLYRSSWLVKKQPGASDDFVTIGCFPQKQNDGARNRPIGLQFVFRTEQIGVTPVELATVDGLAQRLPLPARMAHLLKDGPLTFSDIAAQLDAKVDSAIKAANRGKAFTRVSGSDGITRIALVERHVA